MLSRILVVIALLSTLGFLGASAQYGSRSLQYEYCGLNWKTDPVYCANNFYWSPEPFVGLHMNKLWYLNAEKAKISITGPPSTVLNLTIIAYDTKNKTFSSNVTTNDFGHAVIKQDLKSYQPGFYEAHVRRGSDKLQGVELFTVGLRNGTWWPVQTENNTMALPLTQFDSGVYPTETKCNQGFVLAVKISDSSPACVTQHAIQKLVSRNWGFDPNVSWGITGLKETYKVDQKIDFNVTYKGLVWCCLIPDVIVYGTDGKPAWQTHFLHVCMCPAMIAGKTSIGKYYDKTWNVNDMGFGVLSINKTGTFTVNVAQSINKTIVITP